MRYSHLSAERKVDAVNRLMSIGKTKVVAATG
jgi:hypothetical protein